MMAKEKLRSNRGATLLFAIVALAVAAIVSAVVIYAAQSNAGRILSAQAAEQAQLTLNSAASVVREQFTGNVIELSSTSTETTTSVGGVTNRTETPGAVQVTCRKTADNGSSQLLASGTVSDAGILSISQGDPTDLQIKLLDWSVAIVNGTVQTQDFCSKEYVVKATGPDGNLEDVHVSVRMEPGATNDLASPDAKEEHEAQKYYLTIVFTMDSSPSEKITMTFMATVSESKSSSLVSKTSSTEPGPEGVPITTSTKVVKIDKKVKLNWAKENVVVNVVELNGGST